MNTMARRRSAVLVASSLVYASGVGIGACGGTDADIASTEDADAAAHEDAPQGMDGARVEEGGDGSDDDDGSDGDDGGTCTDGAARCSAGCVDTTTDVMNCGACGVACAGMEVCVLGTCAAPCDTGLVHCRAPASDAGVGADASSVEGPLVCVDPASDAKHCGECGRACGDDELCAASACAYATSCADLLEHVGPIDDGEHTIQPTGRTPFKVHCAGMRTDSPKDYLTLEHTRGKEFPNANYSAYDKGTCQCADDARRFFEKIRLDPATLTVDLTDATFAVDVTTATACWASATGVCSIGRNLPYATTGNCILNGGAIPGNVDLGGTPFSIDPAVTFVPSGYIPYGSSTFSPDRKKVDFTGGGFCGGNAPSGPLVLKQD